MVLATSRHSQERLGHFSYFVGTGPGHKHLDQPVRNVRFIATVAVKDLGMELAFTVSRYVDLLDASLQP